MDWIIGGNDIEMGRVAVKREGRREGADTGAWRRRNGEDMKRGVEWRGRHKNGA